ncbi:2-amino-4-hydroxy-6-hydroxymethyldihydropteridinediphosphokinase [Shewanella loihica]|uniref:2-amino-4-hydroxy-6-hydroxymethyldihydropteridine pyrophosphokinase n=1 Tax=Shewanella loihica (strain ATCC BAA-1088 / PV-4) TaxID=323850 RepID=A3QHQ0_SHELP|nr:2-amino-4-hydroxy-6-hydroxymethyldihydropteridine diphosphokinase [Shewanella loihica]ABO24998.1 2-amino-4-hydroxy-6-hydroxymethyldihydropteridine pyrophosphokinase [Shewanella loihica PV-4]
MNTVYVALGANLASPKAQLDQACQALKALASDGQLSVSPYYQSAPMGDVPQPDYLNAVARFTTTIAPLALLDALQAIENEQGRVREVRWGARTLDLDLLLYGDWQLDIPRLQVPHYGMKTRSFVLLPLLDLAPDLILPCGTKLTSLITEELKRQVQQLGPDH